MQRLKTIPFFLVLLAVFFCLHGAAENFGSLTVKEVMLTGISILAVTLISFGMVWFFSKNVLRAALLVFFICTWFFFFGALHDFIKSTGIFFFVKSYTVLLPLLIIATICWFMFLKRNPQRLPKITLYLNMVSHFFKD